MSPAAEQGSVPAHASTAAPDPEEAWEPTAVQEPETGRAPAAVQGPAPSAGPFADLADLPVAEHVAVFEAEHARLQHELSTIDRL